MQMLHLLGSLTFSHAGPYKLFHFDKYIFRIGFSCIRRKCHLNYVVSPADINYFITQYIMKTYKTAWIIPPYFYILCDIMAAYMFLFRCEYFINWLLLCSENLVAKEQADDYEWRHKVTYSQHCKYKNYSHQRLFIVLWVMQPGSYTLRIILFPKQRGIIFTKVKETILSN